MIQSIILSIIADRKRRHIKPAHALLSEVQAKARDAGMARQDVLDALKALREGGMIEAGHTINDIWIKLKKQGNNF